MTTASRATARGYSADLLAREAANAHAAAHVGHQERLGAADLVAQCAADILAHELVAHGRASVAHGDDLGRGQVLLRVAAKEQDARVGGHEVTLGRGLEAASRQQRCRRRWNRQPRQPLQIACHGGLVQFSLARARRHRRLEMALAAGDQQRAQLGRAHGAVLLAGARQVLALDAVDLRQARRHMHHAQLAAVQRHDLRQRQHQRRLGQQGGGQGLVAGGRRRAQPRHLTRGADAQHQHAAMGVGQRHQRLAHLARAGRLRQKCYRGAAAARNPLGCLFG